MKSKFKFCDYASFDGLVRDKFVFSIRDLAVKDKLSRDDKLTLEKAIRNAMEAEASNERIKAMGPQEQTSQNPSINEIRSGGKRKREREKNFQHRPALGFTRKIVSFMVLLTHRALAHG